MSRNRTRREVAEAERRAREAAEKKKRVQFVSASVVALVVAIIGVVILVGGGGSSGGSKTATDSVASTSAEPANLTDGALVSGTGPVKLTLYEDLQCPACKAFEASTGSTISELEASGAITIERRPLAFLDRASTTDYSTRALNALGCVVNVAPTKATGFISALFEDQPKEGSAGLTDATLASMATAAGAPDVTPCITGLTYKGWTERQTTAAFDAKVESTPTVLVNGKVLDDRSPDGLRAAVQAVA